jgi:ribosomal protein S1
MRVSGIITEYNSNSGGYGKIKCDAVQDVRFERSECTYENIMINDNVRFDLIKSFDGIYDALNIEFISNFALGELDRSYQKQLPISCRVLFKTPKGYVISYKNINLFLPDALCFEQLIEIDKSYEVYITTFTNNNPIIIASLKKYKSDELISKFNPFVQSKISLLFEVIAIEEFGIIMNYEDKYNGFVPNSHIFPFDKKELNVGDKFYVKVISCAMPKGLVLSIRNHYASDIISNIKKAFEENYVLSGRIERIEKKFYLIKYNDLNFKMNLNHILETSLTINDEIKFKIINFSYSDYISISNIEISEFGLIEKLRANNLFLGKVVEKNDNGLIISLNEYYNSAFLPLTEITDCPDKKQLFDRIKIGMNVHCSIIKFDYLKLVVSRRKYKKTIRHSKVTSICKLNSKVQVKIKDRISFFGLPVENNYFKGIIAIEDIFPIEIIENIDLLKFIQHSREYPSNFFKRNSILSAIISKIDKENNRIYFDFDLSDFENKKKIEEIISFFSDDEEKYSKLKIFYEEKEKKQIFS